MIFSWRTDIKFISLKDICLFVAILSVFKLVHYVLIHKMTDTQFRDLYRSLVRKFDLHHKKICETVITRDIIKFIQLLSKDNPNLSEPDLISLWNEVSTIQVSETWKENREEEIAKWNAENIPNSFNSDNDINVNTSTETNTTLRAKYDSLNDCYYVILHGQRFNLDKNRTSILSKTVDDRTEPLTSQDRLLISSSGIAA
jgi:hypothetical protein